MTIENFLTVAPHVYWIGGAALLTICLVCCFIEWLYSGRPPTENNP